MFDKVMRREPERCSAIGVIVKVVLIAGAVSAIAVAAYVAYKKFEGYMRRLVEENCDDYLDDCCCECDDCADGDCEAEGDAEVPADEKTESDNTQDTENKG